jgi:uncharacterized membrane protein
MKACRLAAVVALIVLACSPALAQTGGGYDLTWSTLDAGGGASSGGGYSLSGTIGQPDAGALNGGGYVLRGGFWTGGAYRFPAYLPLIVR